MDSQPRSAPVRHVDVVESVRGLHVGLLGRVESSRGVRLLAVNSLPDCRAENRVKTDTAAFWYSLRRPKDAAVSVDGGRSRPAGALGFWASDLPLWILGNRGRYTTTICSLGSGFLAALAETDGALRLGGIDLLSSIESPRLMHLGQMIFHEAINPGFSGSLFAEAAASAIILEIARYNGERSLANGPRRGGLAPWQMRRLDGYIRANLSGNLTYYELAMLLGMSVRHLSRAVRQTKGTSLHRWIGSYRLAEARRMLSETHLSIDEIARRSGFRSSAAFSTAFRNAAGFAPREFRRLFPQFIDRM